MKAYAMIFLMALLSLQHIQGQENEKVKELSVSNLSIMVREGRPMPDGTKEENSASISFELNNALLADRVKVIVRQISTQEILDVKTIKFSERDSVAFYSVGGQPRRMKRNVVMLDVNVGELSQNDIEVEVYGIDKKNKPTAKLKR